MPRQPGSVLRGAYSDNPYGTVVEAAFKQDVARHGGQVVALQRYAHDKAAMAGPVKNVAQAARRRHFHPGWRRRRADVVQALAANGVNTKKISFSAPGCGTIRASGHAGSRRRLVRGARSPASAPSPHATAPATSRTVQTATLAYDAVALIAALVKTQSSAQKFSVEVLTNPSGFS